MGFSDWRGQFFVGGLDGLAQTRNLFSSAWKTKDDVSN